MFFSQYFLNELTKDKPTEQFNMVYLELIWVHPSTIITKIENKFCKQFTVREQ